MTNLPSSHSYNFGDTFGDPVETTINTDIEHAHLEDGAWCNQADGILEQDDAIRAQGGRA